MKVLLKYLRASAASSGDLNPTNPNCLEVPSLQSMGLRHMPPCCYFDVCVLHNTYLDLTTLASVTSPFAEKCSRSLASLTYFGKPFTHSLLAIRFTDYTEISLRMCLQVTQKRWTKQEIKRFEWQLKLG